MRKVLIVMGLVLASASALADDASMQMVLDSVHSKGFTGCDKEIRESDYFRDLDNISHVETKSLFGKASNDEIEVIYGQPGNAQYDWEGAIHGVVIRKVGKQCLFAQTFSVVSSISRGCNQVAKTAEGSSYAVVSKGDGSFWVRMSSSNASMDSAFAKAGADTIYTPVNGGGCRLIGLASDMAR